jgi:hypothetical protein
MSEDETVEARLRRLEDLEEIRGLVMAYRRHLGSGDLRAFSELFSEHGVWVGNTGHGRGPEGIRTMLEQRLAPNPPAPGPTRFHLVSDPSSTSTATEPRAACCGRSSAGVRPRRPR